MFQSTLKTHPNDDMVKQNLMKYLVNSNHNIWYTANTQGLKLSTLHMDLTTCKSNRSGSMESVYLRVYARDVERVSRTPVAESRIGGESMSETVSDGKATRALQLS